MLGRELEVGCGTDLMGGPLECHAQVRDAALGGLQKVVLVGHLSRVVVDQDVDIVELTHVGAVHDIGHPEGVAECLAALAQCECYYVRGGLVELVSQQGGLRDGVGVYHRGHPAG